MSMGREIEILRLKVWKERGNLLLRGIDLLLSCGACVL